MFDQIASIRYYGPKIVAGNIVLTVLTTGSLALRILAKATTKARYGVEDYFIIIAHALWYVQAGIQIYVAQIGQQVTSLTDPLLATYIKYVVIGGEMYFPTVLCISLSILFFYRRIFPLEGFGRIVLVIIILHVLWAISGFVVNTFPCWPIDTQWNDIPNFEAKCINYPQFFLASMCIEVVLNTSTLVLPISQVMQLQLGLWTRVSVSSIFLLGGMSVITAIIRIKKTYIPGEIFIDLGSDMFWLSIHEVFALLCASLPLCRPLVRMGAKFLSSSIRKLYGSGYLSRRNATASNRFATSPTTPSERELIDEDSVDFVSMKKDAGGLNDGMTTRITIERTIDVV